MQAVLAQVRRRLVAGLAIAVFSASATADVMTFVMDPFPPFTYAENGVAAGPMSDTIRAVCKLIKAQCRLEVYPWRRALKMAEDGLVDGLYAVANIPEREQFFYVSPPIIESAYGVFVHESSTLVYRRPSDFAGYTVGAYGPSAASKALDGVAQSEPTLVTVTEVDNTTMLRKLSNRRYGAHGAAVANVDVGKYLIRHEKIPALKVVGLIGKTEYSIGLSRKKVDPAQAEEFMTALRQLMKSGRVREIAEHYGVVAAPSP
ncbi:MAG: amino acid ABC transporter substrate-binding protein [Betaproteobacteria bacterium]|nr:MAG: amino acid ABC transporter substrate-binding protein [Betaproteobacteria bacterium]